MLNDDEEAFPSYRSLYCFTENLIGQVLEKELEQKKKEDR